MITWMEYAAGALVFIGFLTFALSPFISAAMEEFQRARKARKEKGPSDIADRYLRLAPKPAPPPRIRCDYCNGTEFYEGPSGGMSTNIMCAHPTCGHWFNASPFGMDDLHQRGDQRVVAYDQADCYPDLFLVPPAPQVAVAVPSLEGLTVAQAEEVLYPAPAYAPAPKPKRLPKAKAAAKPKPKRLLNLD